MKKMSLYKEKKSIFQIPESCPCCSKRYHQAKVSVINRDRERIIVHITCPNCGISVLSSISLNNLGLMAVGMLTDVSQGDLKILEKYDSITLDDVIEIHEYIEKNRSVNFKHEN